MSLSFLAFEAELISTQKLDLGNSPGSWIRGMLGVSLVKQICLFDKAEEIDCASCGRQNYCSFPVVFRPRSAGSNATPGWILHGWTLDPKGYHLKLRLVFAGSAISAMEDFIQTLANQPQSPDSIRFYLKQVKLLPYGRVIYENKRILPFSLQKIPPVSLDPVPPLAEVKIFGSLISKYELDKENQLFSVLCNRLSRLDKHYHLFEDNFLPDLKAIEVPWVEVENNIRKASIELPKNSEFISCTAWKGSWVLAEIHPLAWQAINLASWVHLGRNCVQGFGNIIINGLL